MIFISSHAPFSNDGKPIANTGYAIPLILEDEKIPFYCVYHSLYGGMKSYTIISQNGKAIRRYEQKKTSTNLVIKTIQEFYSTYSLLKKCLLKTHTIDVYIGVDPLNAVYGIIAKHLFGKKIKSIVFYTADYAEKRFSNLVLNTIYHLIDRIAVKMCDSNWVVSKQIQKMRILSGENEQKIQLFPNALYLKNRPKVDIAKKNRFHFVLVSTIIDSISIGPLIKTLGKLKKKYPEIKLTIVGIAELPPAIKQLSKTVGMELSIDTIKYLNHENLVSLMNLAGVGISLYQQTEKNPWLKYSDSMKTRDYIASGCPVIISDFLDISSEVIANSLGVKTNFVKLKNMNSSISRIVENEEKYLRHVHSCLQYAKVTSPEKTFLQLIGKTQ